MYLLPLNLILPVTTPFNVSGRKPQNSPTPLSFYVTREPEITRGRSSGFQGRCLRLSDTEAPKRSEGVPNKAAEGLDGKLKSPTPIPTPDASPSICAADKPLDRQGPEM